MKKTILILMSLLVLSCENQNHKSDIEKLETENASIKKRNDSLNKELQKAKIYKNYWYDGEYDGIGFINKGIKNPEEFIETSLRKMPQLIPLGPTLGGTMRFENIQVLSEKWVIADYSDGHVTGKSIYNYKLNSNNLVEFKILYSISPE
jgi:hypothetical protein